ncbi:helix-turn-helix transcriptional regulator [Propioniciclava soli]|uniref:ArsR family transcriptional regulator n=1 Tax=Propioniciclava soli TaxID=2775081 RepID=A0ABZ3C599_9ACTN|nr:helix-turn-helix domain-containing protein [Propioniciclava soli]
MDEELGPAPTPTGALSPARARVARALGHRGPGVALADLADELGGHPNATRAHLDAMVAEGHAETAERQGAGRGRPARVYTLTAAGRRALAGPVAPVSEVLDAVVAHLAHEPDAAARAHAIGRAWGASRRGDAADLLATLDALGFSPDPAGGGPSALIRLRTCPMLASARAHPDVVCGMHAGLVQGALPEAADGLRVVPFAEPGCCWVEFDGTPGRPRD